MVHRLMLAGVLLFSLAASGGFVNVSCLDWSPDGTLFLFSHLGQLYLGEAPDGRAQRPINRTDGVDWARFAPSGEWIVYATPVENGYAIWQHPIEEEGERKQLHFSSSIIAQPVVAPDETRIAFLSTENGAWDLYLLDLETEEVARITNTTWPISTPDFAPNGREIAFVGLWEDNWDLFILDLDTNTMEQLTADAHYYWAPRFAPDAEWIALESYRQEQSDIYVIRRDGSGLTPFTTDRWRNAFPAWSPDGKALAYASKRVGGWVFIAEGTY